MPVYSTCSSKSQIPLRYASSELAPNMFAASSELASVMECTPGKLPLKRVDGIVRTDNTASKITAPAV